MVEGATLEMLCRGNSTVGSNPTLSAIFTLKKVILKSFRVPYSYVILYVFLYVIYKIKKPTLQLVVLIFEKFLFL